MNVYKPISCDYHSILEHYAVKSEIVEIVYTEANTYSSYQGLITDIYTKAKEEFLVLDHSKTIRLDKIIKINGEMAPTTSKSCVYK